MLRAADARVNRLTRPGPKEQTGKMGYDSVFRAGLFAERTYVVTGGGSGIGRCTAHELAALGATPVLVGRKAEKLEKTAAEITEDGGRCDWAVCDVRDEGQVDECLSAICGRHPRIHGLVNNAGGQFPSPLVGIRQKGFETVVRTNLVGGFLMAKGVYERWMQTEGGVVVNVVADMWRGMPGMGHSGAARAGMVNFTRTAAVEWAASGVRVNAVAPGWVASSGLDHYPPELGPMIRQLRHAVPLKRLATEAEVSAAICFLLSDAASFITGATLPVDGGAPLANSLWPIPDHACSEPFDPFHRSKRPCVLDEETE
jgi:citronellol/citronellal dehydrogenase